MKASFLASWFFPIQSTSNRSLSGASAAAYKPMDLWQRFFYKVFIPKLCSLPWLVSLALLVRVKYLTTAAESGHCVVSGKKTFIQSKCQNGFRTEAHWSGLFKKAKIIKRKSKCEMEKVFYEPPKRTDSFGPENAAKDEKTFTENCRRSDRHLPISKVGCSSPV